MNNQKTFVYGHKHLNTFSKNELLTTGCLRLNDNKYAMAK